MANAMVLLALGVPFIHCGQEFGRTKQGLGNTYNRSDNYNRVDYQRRDHHIEIVERTKELIQLRKEHPCFRLSTVDDGNSNALETQDIHIASFSVVVCQFGLTA